MIFKAALLKCVTRGQVLSCQLVHGGDPKKNEIYL